jgi:hypothetical protein
VIPDTCNGLPAMACVSAMLKCIRRGLEREAMEFAVELIHSSKAFHSMVCKRLEIISHEDINTQADPPSCRSSRPPSLRPCGGTTRRSRAHHGWP